MNTKFFYCLFSALMVLFPIGQFSYGAVQPNSKKMDAKLAKKMIFAQMNQIKTLSIKYNVRDKVGKPPHQVAHIRLKWDLIHNYVYERVVIVRKPHEKPYVMVWVRNSHKAWRAYPSSYHHIKGLWNVTVMHPKPWKSARGLFGTGLKSLRRIWTPWTVMFSETAITPLPELPAGKLSSLKDNRYVLKYLIPPRDGPDKSSPLLQYNFSLDHGLKLHATKLIGVYPNGSKKVQILSKRSDYVKSNGIWFPKTFVHKLWLIHNGKLSQNIVLHVQSVQINIKFKKGTFVYHPTWGSRITNVITKQTYRYGWHGLHHPPNAAHNKSKKDHANAHKSDKN